MSGFRDYQSVIQVGVRRGDTTRRAPLDPEEVRALFGRMVRQVWTPAEIDILRAISSSSQSVVAEPSSTRPNRGVVPEV